MNRLVLDLSSIPPRPAGVGRYGIELGVWIPRLMNQNEGFSIVASTANLSMLTERLSDPSILALAPGSPPVRLIWEQVVLGRKLRGNPLLHGLHYTLPRGYKGSTVVTVHDLTMMDYPMWHERSKVIYFRQAMSYASRHASAIVVPSQATRERYLHHFDPRCEVTVIHHGVQGRFLELSSPPSIEPTDRYLLYVGTIEPRKGIVELVSAFESLASSDSDLQLVIVGQVGWKAEQSLDALANSPYRPRIRQLGYVTDEMLGDLYRGCAAFVYPSYAEGFGLPAIEAMGFGVPVVTTSPSAMSEVCGDVAYYCHPKDAGALRDAIGVALADQEFSPTRRAKGIELASQFTWEKSAKAHVELYRSLW